VPITPAELLDAEDTELNPALADELIAAGVISSELLLFVTQLKIVLNITRVKIISKIIFILFNIYLISFYLFYIFFFNEVQRQP
jgi:hypothetical protein